MEKKKIYRKKREGIVVSSKMKDTAVVLVSEVKVSPKYHKRFLHQKKFKAANPLNKFIAGEKVVIEETRPLSRDKNWRIIGKVK